MMLVSVSAFLILLMYFLAGISKISNFSATAQGLKSTLIFKVPNIFYKIAILAAILLEIVAPLTIMFSLQTNMSRTYAYYSSVMLALFTVVITLIYHFPTNEGQYIPFMKNTTAIGALLLLSTFF
jgi:hypothetical protein